MTPDQLQQIKLADPGGDLDTAFAALAAETETVQFVSNIVNVRTIAARYGMSVAEGIRQVVEANFPAWVHDAFVNEGLDVANQNTQDNVSAPPFTAEQVGQLLSFTSKTQLRFPGLKPGHLLEARQL